MKVFKMHLLIQSMVHFYSLNSRMAILVIVLAGGFPWLASMPVNAEERREAKSETAQDHMNQGTAKYQQGLFGEAARHWTQAAQHYETNGETRQQAHALIALGQALQYLGETNQALAILERAREIAESIPAPDLMAAIWGRAGNLWVKKGNPQKGLEALTQALELARTREDSAQTARLLNDTGNALVALDRLDAAVGAYAESTILARETDQTSLVVVSQLNATNAEIDQGVYANALPRLEVVETDLPRQPDGFDKLSGFLKVGLAFQRVVERMRSTGPYHSTGFAQPDPVLPHGTRGVETRPLDGRAGVRKEKEPESSWPSPRRHLNGAVVDVQGLAKKAVNAFQAAVTLASKLKDSRSESYAWGYLGNMYEQERRWEEALTLTRRAIHAAQKADAPESLYRWQWQTGRLYRALEKHREARQAYRQALATLQPIHGELFGGTPPHRTTFRQWVGALYFELADLLLRQAAENPGLPQAQTWLQEAQRTIEEFKTVELQDYFQDQCVESAREHGLPLDQPTKETAVLYPIMLPDRLELLVRFPSGLKQWTLPVTEETLKHEIRGFRQSLQNPHSRDVLTRAQRFYDWLIRPIETELVHEGIKTIVFVPEGSLGTIPLATLHDGTDYLISKYALTTTPGLTLTHAQPLPRGPIKVLVLGLTEATQNFPPLPHVRDELAAIQSLYEGKALLDRQFTVSHLEEELKSQKYNIVHIASHGLVERDKKQTFVLAFDQRLTMERLADMMGSVKFGIGPLDLLTLSACQTAIGDDQAALGLAGMAVKSGAQSALASLWFIDDAATAQLVTEFYRQLHDHPANSKAEALRQAQLSLLRNPSLAHPSQWASLILIGNWL